MSRIPLAATFLSSLVLTPAAAAQPDTPPPTITMTFWQCERNALDQLIEYEHTRALPIYQSMVNSGRVFDIGTMVHAWGDQFNYVTYLVAADLATAIAANDEITEAYSAQYPDDNFLLQSCSSHFDNIYTARFGNGIAGAVTPDAPATVALSFWRCPQTEIGRLMEGEAATWDVANTMTSEGLWRGMGFMTHSWGDVWNVVRYAGADTLPELLTAFDTFDERLEASVPDDAQGLNETCTAHRDNIYELVVQTTPRQQ